MDFVVNCDLPSDSKTYTQRVGRTARAGKSGVALSLVTQYDWEIWLRVEKVLGRELDEYKPEKEEVMVFANRVHDARRIAITALKEQQTRQGSGVEEVGIGNGGAEEMKWTEKRLEILMIKPVLGNSLCMYYMFTAMNATIRIIANLNSIC